MIYQTDIEFACRPQIRHGGCFFLSILYALASKFRLPFTHEVIISFYDKELKNNHTDVDNEMFIGDAQNLIDDFAGAGIVHYVGWADAEYVPAAHELAWGVWHRDGTDFNHFTFGTNRIAPDFYDPWAAGGSASVAHGKLIGQRIGLIL